MGAANIIALLVFIYIVFSIQTQGSKLDRTTRDTHRALCALRGDLERRVADSRAFLRDHPDGIPGVTAREIQVGISNQERTITALRFIKC